MDLSKLSDADLAALEAGDLSKMSDAGLAVVESAGQPATRKTSAMDPANAALTGYNRGLVNILGMPVDTMQNVVDLGKAALGTPWLMAGKVPPDALQVQDRAGVVGSGEYLRKVLSGTSLGNSAINPANPAYEGGYLQAMGAGAAGAVNPAQAAMGAVSAAAGKTAADATGRPEYAIAASLAAPALMRGAVARPLAQADRTARDVSREVGQREGYVVPPSQAGAGWVNDRLESIAGKAALNQDATLRNQATTNRLMARDVGLTPNTLNLENLRGVRAEAYDRGYAPINRIPRVDSTPAYRQALRDLEVDSGRPISPIRALRNPGVSELTDDLNQQYFSGKEANQLMRQLREQGSSKINSSYGSAGGDHSRELGSAMRKGSGLLEDLLIEHLQSAGPSNVVPQLRDARRAIAKSYTAESAFNPATGDIDPGVLAAMYRKQKPLSGDAETAGRFAAAFPLSNRLGATTQTPGVSALEATSVPMLGALTRTAVGEPAGWLASGIPLVRAPVRNLLLSKYYQRLFAKQRGKHDTQLTPQEQGALAASLAAQGSLDGDQ